jgi:hypothetical protein
MARRSPWTNLSIVKKEQRKKVKEIREAHNALSFGEKITSLAFVIKKGVDALTYQEQVDFLKKHKNVVCSLIRKNGGLPGLMARPGKSLEEGVFEMVVDGKYPEDLLRGLVAVTFQTSLKNESPQFLKNLHRRFVSYLEARKIPFDSAVLDLVTEKILREEDIKYLMFGKFDFARFERAYIGALKDKRKETIETAALRNYIFREAFPRNKFTVNQTKAVRSWIDTVIRDYRRAWRRAPGEHEREGNLSRVNAETFIQETVGAARQKFSQFSAPKVQNGRVPVSKQTVSVIKKPGSRQERIANYSPREKEASRVATAIQERENVVRVLGQQSNPLEQSLVKIGAEDGVVVAQRLRTFSTRGLSTDMVGKLSIVGSLSRKCFFAAIDSKRFVERFGEQKLDSLARIIAYIGPEGKEISIVKRFAARSVSSGPEIYSFLVKNGILDEGHVGGTVVYLARL